MSPKRSTEIRRARMAQGLCVYTSGCQRPLAEGSSTCQHHLDLRNKRYREDGDDLVIRNDMLCVAHGGILRAAIGCHACLTAEREARPAPSIYDFACQHMGEFPC